MDFNDLVNVTSQRSGALLSDDVSALLPADDFETFLRSIGPTLARSIMTLSKEGVTIPKQKLMSILQRSVTTAKNLNNTFPDFTSKMSTIRSEIHTTSSLIPISSSQQFGNANSGKNDTSDHPKLQDVVDSNEHSDQALAVVSYKPVITIGNSHNGPLGELLEGLTAATKSNHHTAGLIPGLYSSNGTYLGMHEPATNHIQSSDMSNYSGNNIISDTTSNFPSSKGGNYYSAGEIPLASPNISADQFGNNRTAIDPISPDRHQTSQEHTQDSELYTDNNNTDSSNKLLSPDNSLTSPNENSSESSSKSISVPSTNNSLQNSHHDQHSVPQHSHTQQDKDQGIINPVHYDHHSADARLIHELDQPHHFIVGGHKVDTTTAPQLDLLLQTIGDSNTPLSVADAFTKIGNPLPLGIEDPGELIGPSDLSAGDIVSFEGKEALYLGNELVYMDGKVIYLSDAITNHSNFRGFFHPKLLDSLESGPAPVL